MTETSLAYLPVNACYKLSQLGKKNTRQVLFSLSRLVERQGGYDISSMVAGSLPKRPHCDLTGTMVSKGK